MVVFRRILRRVIGFQLGVLVDHILLNVLVPKQSDSFYREKTTDIHQMLCLQITFCSRKLNNKIP